MAKAKKPAPIKLLLTAEERTITGKAVKKLRKAGKIPANVFGTDFKSLAITVDAKAFQHVYKVAHETGIVYIQAGTQALPTLVTHVQKHPLNDWYLHIDFRKIDLTKKIETAVPIRIIGTSPAVAQKDGVLITMSAHLLIEALPADIPSHIEIDISQLDEIGDEIKVADLAKSDTYEIKEEAGRVVVSVTAHKEESVIAETAVAAPEITTEKAPVEGTATEAAPAAAPPKTAPKKDEKKQ